MILVPVGDVNIRQIQQAESSSQEAQAKSAAEHQLNSRLKEIEIDEQPKKRSAQPVPQKALDRAGG